MVASAENYAWFTEQCAELADAYRLTLVRGRTPAEVIELLGGTEPIPVTGLQRLPGLTGEARAERPEASGGVVRGGFAGAAEFGDWTLIVEPAGAPDSGDQVVRDQVVRDQAVRELSRGTELVSHSDDEHSDARFVWARDGEVLLDFDPSGGNTRRGSDPDRLVGILERLGFDPSGEDSEATDAAWSHDSRYRERALALAEELSGVHLTLEALETATFFCAALPGPAALELVGSGPAPIPAPRAAPERRGSRAESWDDEYEIDDVDDNGEDGDAEGDEEERDWPRLMAASARRIGKIFR
ncbi:DUF6461 domain-containing protein [Actinoplanes sp. GCM10030250]|uniref:DUF6461 domain-containing protein n=1 Tax=Actinoplanes sp. GCM10030250 TaxID=3273376 RepID=UPI00360613FC